jgi:hypothetical protein
MCLSPGALGPASRPRLREDGGLSEGGQTFHLGSELLASLGFSQKLVFDQLFWREIDHLNLSEMPPWKNRTANRTGPHNSSKVDDP